MINESYPPLWTINERGLLFEGSAVLSESTTAGTTIDSYIQTGDNPIYLLDRGLGYTGGNMSAAIIEDSDLTIGDDNGVVCLNRDKQHSPSFTIGAVTTVNTIGTTYARDPRTFIETSTGQKNTSNFIDNSFVKLKANTTYHLQVTPASSSMYITSTVLIYDPNATVSA